MIRYLALALAALAVTACSSGGAGSATTTTVPGSTTVPSSATTVAGGSTSTTEPAPPATVPERPYAVLASDRLPDFPGLYLPPLVFISGDDQAVTLLAGMPCDDLVVAFTAGEWQVTGRFTGPDIPADPEFGTPEIPGLDFVVLAGPAGRALARLAPQGDEEACEARVARLALRLVDLGEPAGPRSLEALEFCGLGLIDDEATPVSVIMFLFDGSDGTYQIAVDLPHEPGTHEVTSGFVEYGPEVDLEALLEFFATAVGDAESPWPFDEYVGSLTATTELLDPDAPPDAFVLPRGTLAFADLAGPGGTLSLTVEFSCANSAPLLSL